MPIFPAELNDAIDKSLSLVNSRIIYNGKMLDTINELNDDNLQDFFVTHILGSNELYLLFSEYKLNNAIHQASNFKGEVSTEMEHYTALKSRFESLKTKMEAGVDVVALSELIDQIRDCIYSTLEKKIVIQRYTYGLIYGFVENAAIKDKKRASRLFALLPSLKETIGQYDEVSYYKTLVELFPFQSGFELQIERYIIFSCVEHDVLLSCNIKGIEDWRHRCTGRLNGFSIDQLVDQTVNDLLKEHQKLLDGLAAPRPSDLVATKAQSNEMSTACFLTPEMRRLFHIQAEIERKLEGLEARQTQVKTLIQKKAELLRTESNVRAVLNKELCLSHKKIINALIQCKEDISLWNEVQTQQQNEVHLQQRLLINEDETSTRQRLEADYRTELSRTMSVFKRTISQALRLAAETARPLSSNHMQTLEQIYQFGVNGTMPNLAFHKIEGLIEAVGGRKTSGKTTGSHQKYQVTGLELHIINHDHEPVQSVSKHGLTLVKPHKGNNKYVERFTLKMCYEIFSKVGIFKKHLAQALAEPKVRHSPLAS